jgi:hypothetical protein
MGGTFIESAIEWRVWRQKRVRWVGHSSPSDAAAPATVEPGPRCSFSHFAASSALSLPS